MTDIIKELMQAIIVTIAMIGLCLFSPFIAFGIMLFVSYLYLESNKKRRK